MACETVPESASEAAQKQIATLPRVNDGAAIVAGLAALYACASKISESATARSKASDNLRDSRRARASGLFAVNENADRFHGETGAARIARHAKTREDNFAAIDAADRALSRLWSMLDSVRRFSNLKAKDHCAALRFSAEL